MNEEDKELLRKYREKSKFAKKIESLAWRLIVDAVILYKVIKRGGKVYIPSYTNRNNRFSLFENDIASPTLWVPGEEKGELVEISSKGGTMSSYKHRNGRVDTDKNMKLGGFKLDEYMDRDKFERTPSYDYDPRVLENMLETEFSAFERLLEGEFVISTAYSKAYERIYPGNEVIQDALRQYRIQDETVYQVTPKGNSLVLLFLEGGNKTPKPKSSFEPSFGKPAMVPIPIRN